MALDGCRSAEQRLERRAVRPQPREHVVEHRVEAAAWPPAGGGRDCGVVGDVVRDVGVAGRVIGVDRNRSRRRGCGTWPSTRPATRCSGARRRRCRARPSGAPCRRSARLTSSTRSSTCRTSRTWRPSPPKPDVGQPAAVEMAGGPEDEEALIDLAHLPRAGDDAAAVDHRVQRRTSRGIPRSGAPRRAWWRRTSTGSRTAGTPRSARLPTIRCPEVPSGMSSRSPWRSSGSARSRAIGIDAARRQEDHAGARAAGGLEAIDGARQIRLDDIRGALRRNRPGPRARPSSRAGGRNGRLRRGRRHSGRRRARTPPTRRRRRGSASSLPRRRRLSKAHTRSSGAPRRSDKARLRPTKPAPPVIRIRIPGQDPNCADTL